MWRDPRHPGERSSMAFLTYGDTTDRFSGFFAYPSPHNDHIALVAFDGVQSLDLTGPVETLVHANHLRGSAPPAYRVEVLAPRPGAIRTSSGLTILPDATIADRPGPFHTVIVAGGIGTREAARDPALLLWLRGAAACAERVA